MIHMRTKTLLAVSIVSAALTGCAVMPNVTYRPFSDPGQQEGWIPYQLTDTTLVIGLSGQAPSRAAPTDISAPSPKPPGDGPNAMQGTLYQPVTRAELYPIHLDTVSVSCVADECDGLVAATAVPIAYDGMTLALVPEYRNFVRTFVSPTYVGDTLRLSKLEFSVRDERQEVIDTVFSGISGVQKLARMDGARAREDDKPKPISLALPVVLDLAEAKKTLTAGFSSLPGNKGTWWYRLQFMDNPVASGFAPRAAFGKYHASALTSLCRRARIEITSRDPAKHKSPSADGFYAEGESKLVLGLTVADPDFLLPVPLPPQGSVSFGNLCGATVTPSASIQTPTNVLMDDFFSKVSALRGPRSK